MIINQNIYKKNNFLMIKALLTPITFIGHELLDDIPYQIGGNVRGKDPKKEPIQIDRKTGKIKRTEK